MAAMLPPRGGAASRAGKKEPEAHRARGVGRNGHGRYGGPGGGPVGHRAGWLHRLRARGSAAACRCP